MPHIPHTVPLYIIYLAAANYWCCILGGTLHCNSFICVKAKLYKKRAFLIYKYHTIGIFHIHFYMNSYNIKNIKLKYWLLNGYCYVKYFFHYIVYCKGSDIFVHLSLLHANRSQSNAQQRRHKHTTWLKIVNKWFFHT